MTTLRAFAEFDSFESLNALSDYWTKTDKYRLYEDLAWEIGFEGSGHVETVPSGYTFDLSVPFWLTWLQSRHDRSVLLAAALHDWMLDRGFDRAMAAAEFRRACKARGMSAQRAWLVYFAVLGKTAFK